MSFSIGRIKTILAYIFFEGLSRGGNQLIIFYLSFVLADVEFVSMLLIFSLESFLIIIIPLNYIESLYSFISKYRKSDIVSTIFLFAVFLFLLFSILFFLLENIIEGYFGINNNVIYLSVILIAISKTFFRILSFLFQIEERHSVSINIKTLSYMIPLLSGFVGIFISSDLFIGFFVGRAIGCCITGLVFTLKFGFSQDWFVFNTEILKDFVSRSKYLMINGIVGWVAGLGVINIVNIFQPVDITAQIGYLLNIWMILLLMANGINSVFEPRLRKLLYKSIEKAKNLIFLVHLFYVLVSIGGGLVSYFTIRFFGLPSVAQKFEIVIPFAFLILFCQSFQYTSIPIYYFHNKYSYLSRIIVVSSLFSIGLIIINFYIIEKLFYILMLYSLSYFIRSLPLYLFARKLIIKDVKI